MTGTRWSKAATGLIAGALSLALVACGPAVDGSGTLQSLATPIPNAVQTSSSAVHAPSSVAPPPAPVAATAALALIVSGTTVLAQLSTSTGVPTSGAVTVAVDGTAIGTATVTGGEASIALPAGLPVGAHTVTAQFVSDNAALVSDAAASTGFSAAKAASSITASVGKDTIRYGDQASFDVAVQAPGAPAGADLTGHVTLLDGAEVLAEADTDPAGQATLSVLNRADPGTRTYTVNYSGGAAVEASSSQLSVQTTRTNVDLAVSWTKDVQPGADAVVTVDVIGTPDTPTGSVTISFDGTQISNGPVDGNGKVSGTAIAVPAGDHQIQVSYAGDARFESSTASATLTAAAPVVNPNAAGAAATQSGNPCPAAASACVDLANEQAWLQSAGQITYGPVSITSGAAGSRTRTGMFSVFWRDKNHKSSLFNSAPMPNSVFFDNDIAFHQGSLSNQSNGCIHLSRDAAETFFDTLSVGDAVYVWGAAPY